MSEQTAQSIPLERTALFLDLDGAIVPIAETPDAAKAGTACREVLRRAADELGGRLAILSGRTIAGVDEVLGGAVNCVAGVHGLQRRTPSGAVDLAAPHARIATVADVLQALADARPGLLVERKGASVALHYRQAPGAEAAVIEAVERLAAAHGLQIQLGKAVAELRTPGPDKGAALRSFMTECPFAGARPVFLGDDLTDEPAFDAAQTLGGIGILVGDDRPSVAAGRVSSPAAALSWITQCLDAQRFELPADAFRGVVWRPQSRGATARERPT